MIDPEHVIDELAKETLAELSIVTDLSGEAYSSVSKYW